MVEGEHHPGRVRLDHADHRLGLAVAAIQPPALRERCQAIVLHLRDRIDLLLVRTQLRSEHAQSTPATVAEFHEAAELAEFERRLRTVLEERALAAARHAGPPTPHEARQLAAMAEHARAHGAGEPAPEGRAQGGRVVPVRVSHGSGPSTTAGAGAPVTRAPRTLGDSSGGPKGRAARVAWLAAAAAALALAALGLRSGGAGAAEADPRDDIYLGDPSKRGVTPFEGQVTFDDRGRSGSVTVSVYEPVGDDERLLLTDVVTGTTWRPSGPLPARFSVVVRRPADDGLGEEELFRCDFQKD